MSAMPRQTNRSLKPIASLSVVACAALLAGPTLASAHGDVLLDFSTADQYTNNFVEYRAPAQISYRFVFGCMYP